MLTQPCMGLWNFVLARYLLICFYRTIWLTLSTNCVPKCQSPWEVARVAANFKVAVLLMPVSLAFRRLVEG